MNARRFAFALFALPLAALAACSSSDAGGGSGQTGTIPAAFSKYCSGTLTTQQKIMHPSTGGSWTGTGETIPAGTQFLLQTDFGVWSGYTIASDGTPAKIDADFSKGLVLGTDFSSDCAPAKAPTFGDGVKSVTLAKSTYYPNADFTGTACTLDAATEFSNYSISGGGGSSQVSANELKAKCALDVGYSKDLLYGYLVPRT